MDPRGSATNRLNNPDGALARLTQATGRGFPHLEGARRRTYAERERVQRELATVPLPQDTCVVVFGSWARGELTAGSDHDWAILVDAGDPASRPDVIALAQTVGAVLGIDAAKPGSQDVFGTAFACDELVEQIGLDKDTNTLLTRRMLLLLESAAIVGPEVLERCRTRVLDTYLQRGTKDYRVPRFLLNDLVRYWRTICVDFEGKHWGLAADDGFLTYDDRLHLEAGARGLQGHDRFIGLLGETATREHLRDLRPSERDRSPIWGEIRTCGRELEQSLLSLLYGPELASVTRTHMIF